MFVHQSLLLILLVQLSCTYSVRLKISYRLLRSHLYPHPPVKAFRDSNRALYKCKLQLFVTCCRIHFLTCSSNCSIPLQGRRLHLTMIETDDLLVIKIRPLCLKSFSDVKIPEAGGCVGHF